MDRYDIEAAVRQLVEAGLVPAERQADAVAKLADHWADRIAIWWTVEDVQTNHNQLTDDEAREVLDSVKRNHDATLGVNWDTIEGAAVHLYGEKARHVDEDDEEAGDEEAGDEEEWY